MLEPTVSGTEGTRTNRGDESVDPPLEWRLYCQTDVSEGSVAKFRPSPAMTTEFERPIFD
ncbi:hypothetical protein CV102_24840 [Natronococcus pandeyae]|uniref:Uncharacterized protein n=1 Tax=Natronococcus pandeyae TaxID=2055836 RepID=A0A8J8PYZ3_9EURY|nr:hypothetical protein CV102_24840 [Natronococcus pandeyae]